MALFFPRNVNHYKKDGRTKEEKQTRKMERKEELQGFEHRVYGMNGVGKQTNFIPYSIKRRVIKRVVDGK